MTLHILFENIDFTKNLYTHSLYLTLNYFVISQVIHLKRPLACEDCCCPCCLQSMTVYAPAGILIGSIEQRWSIFKPSYDIKNAAGDVVLKIRGPIFTCGFLRNVNFTVSLQCSLVNALDWLMFDVCAWGVDKYFEGCWTDEIVECFR